MKKSISTLKPYGYINIYNILFDPYYIDDILNAKVKSGINGPDNGKF